MKTATIVLGLLLVACVGEFSLPTPSDSEQGNDDNSQSNDDNSSQGNDISPSEENNPITAENLVFEEVLEQHDNGNVASGFLKGSQDKVVGDTEYSFKGYMSLREDGSPIKAHLSGRNTVPIGVHDFVVSDGQELQFDEDGKVVPVTRGWDYFRLEGDSAVIIGDNNLQIHSNVLFHSNGVVNSTHLVGTNAFALGDNRLQLHKNISFYSNKAINIANLAGTNAFALGGNTFQLHNSLFFHSNGIVDRAKLAGTNTFRLGDNTFQVHGNLSFHSNGVVSVAHLTGRNTATFGDNTYTFSEGSVSFYSNGLVAGAILSGTNTVVVRGNVLRIRVGLSGMRVRFDANGNLVLTGPSAFALLGYHTFTLGGVEYRFSGWVSFHANGVLRRAVLSLGDEGRLISGVLRHWAYAYFNEDGDLVRLSSSLE